MASGRRGRSEPLWPQLRAAGRRVAKIILAEDDESMRSYLVRALERAGHEVRSFAEGASAFEEIKGTNFDLLLTDIVMPEMDGIELARRAAELDPSLKIMFITGFAAVLNGRQPVELNTRQLTRLKPLPLSWAEQRQRLGFLPLR